MFAVYRRLLLYGQGLVGMKRYVDRTSHGADGALVEEWYASTEHVYAFVGGDVKVDVGADRLHCLLGLAQRLCYFRSAFR